jgi:TatD DNase family protein
MNKPISYIDVHTHLNLAAYDSDREAVEARTLSEGVAHINVGTQRDTSAKAVEIAASHEGVYATVGVHPVHTTKSYHDPKELGGGSAFTSRGEVFDPEYYRTLATHDRVVAIGECGFDYFRVEKDTKEKQDAAFRAQIALAKELDKALMLHIRPSEGTMDAYEDALAVLRELSPARANVHFFAGTYEIAKKFWDLGYTTSFTGVITFASQYDEVVKNAPLNMIHAETDAPYVTPKPHRGERNEPMHVRLVYDRIAALRGEDSEVVRLALLKNAERVFQITL